MFRKPKKRPLALRSTSSTTTMATPNHDDDDDGVDDGQVGYDEVKASKNDDGDGDGSNNDNNDNVEENATSDLLQQLRNERLEKIANKSSSLMTTGQSHSNKRKKPNNSNWMHQFKSNDGDGNDGTTTASSARDMATRTAEYHPHTSSNTTNKTTSSNSTTSSTSTMNPSHTTAQQINSSTLSSHQAPRSKFLAGPLRASTFVRTTVRFDYQPDICKDYKDTGFCGFGDTCIYLHDRGETKSGWEMEQEYEDNKKRESQKREKEMERFMEGMMCGEIGTGEGGGGSNKNNNNRDDVSAFNNDDDDNNTGNIEDGLPYACHICRGAFTNPIVTSCQHYFCEECMLARIRGSSGEEGTSSTCPICQKDTNGVLNHPRKLEAKKRRLVGRDGTWDQYYEVGRKRQRGGG